MMDGVELFPEIEEVTQRLRDMPVRLAISSQTPKEALSEILARSGIRDRFEMVVGLGDYQDPKPSPESILMVLNKLGVSANETIYVGDMTEDIVSAKRAGVIPIAVYRNKAAYQTRSNLEAKVPAFLIEDLGQLIKIVRDKM